MTAVTKALDDYSRLGLCCILRVAQDKRLIAPGDLLNILDGLPVVGQYTVVGLLVSIVLFVLIQYFRGEIVPRKTVDQIQATSDQWQKAWEVAMQTQASSTVTLERLTTTLSRVDTLADTMEHVLESLPRPEKGEGE